MQQLLAMHVAYISMATICFQRTKNETKIFQRVFYQNVSISEILVLIKYLFLNSSIHPYIFLVFFQQLCDFLTFFKNSKIQDSGLLKVCEVILGRNDVIIGT